MAKRLIIKSNGANYNGQLKEWKISTCEAHDGTFIQTSNTAAPHATETDLRGSTAGGLFSSEFGSAWVNSLLSMISLFIWFSNSYKKSRTGWVLPNFSQNTKIIRNNPWKLIITPTAMFVKIIIHYQIIKTCLRIPWYQKRNVSWTTGWQITSHCHDTSRKCASLEGWRKSAGTK